MLSQKVELHLKRQEEEIKQNKIFKQKKQQQVSNEFLDEEEMDADLYEYCKKHLK